MRFGLRFNSASSLLIALVALLGLLVPGISLGEADQAPQWQVTKVKQKGWNDRPERGIIMFTSGAQESGAAFRCYLREMSAYLLTDPTDVARQVLDTNRRGTTLAVSYSINGVAETTAHWRRSQGSKIYDVRGTSSIRDVFLAATAGATISVTPKYHDTVVFSLHEADPELVGAFLEACDLKEHLYR